MKNDMKIAEAKMRLERVMNQLYLTATFDQWKLENELRELCMVLGVPFPKEQINVQSKHKRTGPYQEVWKTTRDFCRPETL